MTHTLPPVEFEEIYVPVRHRINRNQKTRRVQTSSSLAIRMEHIRKECPNFSDAMIKNLAKDPRYKGRYHG